MTLELDIGNTRIKWRLQCEGGSHQGVIGNNDIGDLANTVEHVAIPEQILLSCVARPALVEHVTELARLWGAELKLARTLPHQAGVTCGYRNPDQMGVDRWLAVIAAYRELEAPCIVVDAGSAITVDLIDQNGSHLGGYIVPGMQKMRASLFNETSKVKVAELVADTGQNMLKPGESTEEAVSYGLFAMVDGLINRAVSFLSVGSPQVVITGGDAELLQAAGIEGLIRENLVLDGLALVFDEMHS